MLSIQNVTYTKCYLYEMLPRRNVTIRKCTIRNVTDPETSEVSFYVGNPVYEIVIQISETTVLIYFLEFFPIFIRHCLTCSGTIGVPSRDRT